MAVTNPSQAQASLADSMRLKAEAAAQRYRDLVEGVDAIVWEADAASLRFSFVSQRAEKLLGYPLDHWLSTPDFFSQLIHPDDRETIVTRCRSDTAQGRDHELEYRALAADGRILWLRNRVRVVCNADGGPRVLRGLMADITPMVRAEAAHWQLSTVLEATSDFVGISDVHGRILYLNNAGRTYLGIGPEDDVSAKNVTEYQPEAIRRMLREVALPAVIRDGVWHGETELLTHDGRVIPLSQVVVAPKTPQGRVEFFATIARDISDRKRAEQQMAALLGIAKDIGGSLDLDAILDRVQRRTATLLACDRVATFYWDPLRHTFRDIARYGLPPALIAAAKALEFAPGTPIADELTSGKTILVNDVSGQQLVPPALLTHFGIRAFTAAPLAVRGRVLGALMAAHTTADEGFTVEQARLLESIAHHLAVAFETTELYRAQQEEAHIAAALARVGREMISLLDTPQLLERLCQLTTEVLDCDASHTILWKPEEDAFVPIAAYGYPAERWETLRVLVFPRERMAESLGPLEHDEVAQQRMADLADPGLKMLAHELGLTTAMGMALRRGTQMIGIHSACRLGRDEAFTPQQERIARGMAQVASLALENARLVEELGRASRLKSDFVATMSHELRTPLNVIVGYNDLLLDGAFGALTSEQSEPLRRIENSAYQLLDLINTTLDVGRLEAGRLPLTLQNVETTALLHEIDAETRDLQQRRGIAFSWSIPPALPRVHTDPMKLKIVLKNLIGNAVKFTEHGSVTVTAAHTDGHVEFQVIDTGIGIAPETQAIIFEPFRQADSSTTRRHGGVGLGLYIARRLIELLRGTITVHSELGKGATFRVSLPVSAAE
jgi:PAS domain S-box-containing protein